ncbi:MAG: hypothetical protein KJ709_02150 [Nanoarchaeota archaeon]|nr:hypothetical protein [Nanoarchaeota archaeon]
MSDPIRAKIKKVNEEGQMIEFDIREHEGGFWSPEGVMKLVCNRQATIDLITVVTGKKKKGAKLIGLAKTILEGTDIELKFNPK